ncbi:MAG TPA: DUF4446 family protein [Candidatus Moranbacteria bacterium]|nr:DUF4446 family protein [Candidatus Moranbacteria bacterium]
MAHFNYLVQANLIYILASFLFFLIIFLIWNVFLHQQISKLKKKNAILFSGNKVKNLETLLLSQAKTLSILDKDIQELYNISNQINHLSFRSLHKVGLIRFNPFKDVGGNQSFSIALLNGKNNGLVLSSLFTREGARIYAKSVVDGKSLKHPFSKEEKQAIAKAIGKSKK